MEDSDTFEIFKSTNLSPIQGNWYQTFIKKDCILFYIGIPLRWSQDPVGGGGYSVRFRIGMLSTARLLETLQG